MWHIKVRKASDINEEAFKALDDSSQGANE